VFKLGGINPPGGFFSHFLKREMASPQKERYSPPRGFNSEGPFKMETPDTILQILDL